MASTEIPDAITNGPNGAHVNGVVIGHHSNGVVNNTLYPDTNLEIEDRYIDEPRKLRVAVIGAGLAGILAGVLLPAKVPNIELVIYEKNDDVVSIPRLAE